MNSPLRPLRRIIYILVGIVVFGMLGFVVIEDYSMGDAMYIVIQIVTTVGFNEVKPFISWGREFTSMLMILSFGTHIYFSERWTPAIYLSLTPYFIDSLVFGLVFYGVLPIAIWIVYIACNWLYNSSFIIARFAAILSQYDILYL